MWYICFYSVWEFLLRLIGNMCTDRNGKEHCGAENKMFRIKGVGTKILSNNIRSSSLQIGNYRSDVFNLQTGCALKIAAGFTLARIQIIKGHKLFLKSECNYRQEQEFWCLNRSFKFR